MTFDTLLKKNIIFLDGAMGTMLQKHGMQPGESSLDMNLRAPETVKMIHTLYLEAGSDIINSNTFSASEALGKGEDPKESFMAAIKLAKEAAAPHDGLVAADIGPIGKLLEPMGNLSIDRAYEIFKLQASWAQEAGADIIYFETMTDILESKLGILAAREVSSLPVMASMSFEASGRTYLGCSLGAMALTLQAAGAAALGVNCSVGPKEALSMAQEIAKWTDLPIIVKPNAGLPVIENGCTTYNVDAQEFASAMADVAGAGASILGGCCGTSPEYIAALKSAMTTATVSPRPKANTQAICSASEIVADPKSASVDPCLDSRIYRDSQSMYDDIDELTDMAMDCEDDVLLICASRASGDEKQLLKNAIIQIQSAVRVPFRIESSDPDVLRFIDKYYRGKL